MPHSTYTLTVIFSSNGPSMVSSLPLIKALAGTEPLVRYRFIYNYYITIEW